MTDRKLQELMAELPAEYLNEAAAFRAAHHTAEHSTAPAQPELPPRLLHLATPLSAVACLAAVLGLIGWIAQGQQTGGNDSLLNEISEQIPATTMPVETSATETDVTTAEPMHGDLPAPVTTAQEAAKASSETTGKASVGSSSSTGTKSARTQSAAGTAAQTAKTTAPKQTETTPAPLPYDPNIVAQYHKGDVNMDGVITLDDALLLNVDQYNVVYLGKESVLTPEQLYLGDVWNPDMEVTYYPQKGVDSMRSMHLQEAGITESERREVPDYPLSEEDVYFVMSYYTCCHVARTGRSSWPLYPIEQFVMYGEPSPEEAAQYHAPSIESVGTLEADTELETIEFEQFGTLPVRLESPDGERHWYLQKYDYYNASDYIGLNNPVSSEFYYLHAWYCCIEDGSTVQLRIHRYRDGEAADTMANPSGNTVILFAQGEGYQLTQLKCSADSYSRVVDGGAWNLCRLNWADGNFYAECRGGTSEEEWHILADTFAHIETIW